ncbi:terminase [Acidovorax carolinensis]|uniref:Terminase n=1 Tax=Acidovorax carolinensis TaxID=553814 RepID=A0A240UC58_9BURK|nr:terminase TerL endonuclease subunit [Acidovorax carolinensis]ART55509.1 terminase [Acidovorax carolinensis]ART58653.1 terminase [Acidovorax carolinensis]
MTRAARIIQFIEGYLRVPEGKDVGQPMVLAPFQKRFLVDVFDNPAGTRRAILSMGRKGGKTALIAAILAAFVVGPEARQNAVLVSGALSREQASLVFRLCCLMIQQSPKLAPLVRVIPSGKRIIGLPMNTEFRAMSAEAKTAMGASPLLIIGDEWGQVRGPQDDFIDSLVTAQGAHEDPLQIIISTQAANDADWLSAQIDDARNSNDPRIVCHVYEAPAGCDLLDESAWRAANPALGIFRSLDDLREQLTQAQRMPSMENSARNLLLNQRVSTVSPFISQDVWRACAGPVLPFDGPVWCGLDLSARVDLTALVIVGQVDDVWHVQSHFWCPESGIEERSRRDRAPYSTWARQGLLRTTPGASVDYSYVATDMAEILADLDVRAIAFDRWRIDVLKKELDRIGLDLPLEPFGQGFKDVSPALDTLEAELLNGRIAHGGHPVLTMNAANAVIVRDAANNRKLEKSKSTGRIDGLQALTMAMGVASKATEAQGVGFDSFCFV